MAPVGTRVLVTELGIELPIAADGTVTCAGVTVDALAYAPTLSNGTCSAALADAGFVQPPCSDTGPRCGCSTSVTEMSLAALITIALRSMKRRRD